MHPSPPLAKPGLASLLHPLTPAEFFSCSDASEAFVVDGAAGTGELRGLPFLQSLQKLLGAWPYPVQAHLPKVADEASAIEVSAVDAPKLFENGMGLMFDHAERISPELAVWLEAIRADLGFSALTQSRCLIYATPNGKGTAPHFDQNANFVLQLHGTKKWWLAPNQNVENPLSRHTMGLPADPELESYADSPFPTHMPSETFCKILTPGTLLYVPRGMWHTTAAEGDALSLNFTYTAPAYLDLFMAALRSRLALSPEWRATAEGVSDPFRREAAEAQFDGLLVELIADLPHWQAGEILAVTDAS